MDISTFHNSFTDAHLSPSGKHSVHENMKKKRPENRKIPKISPPPPRLSSYVYRRDPRALLSFKWAEPNTKDL